MQSTCHNYDKFSCAANRRTIDNAVESQGEKGEKIAPPCLGGLIQMSLASADRLCLKVAASPQSITWACISTVRVIGIQL